MRSSIAATQDDAAPSDLQRCMPRRPTDPSRRAAIQRELARPERLATLHATGLLDSAPEAAFDRWTTWLSDVLGVKVAALSLVDRDRQFFKSVSGESRGRRETPIEGSMCQYVVADDRPFVVDDTRADPDLADHMAVEQLNTGAYAGVPVHAAGEVLGALCVTEPTPRAWQDHEVALLRQVSLAISTELELRASAGHLARAHAALAHQSRIHELIARGALLSEVLHLLAEGIEREIPEVDVEFDLAGGPAETPWEIDLLGEGGRHAGALRLRGAATDAPDPAQSRLLADAAALAAVALEREHTLEQLTRRATLDELTSLPNRSLFLDRLTQALTRARRTNATTVVAFVDLDRFKWVNDSLGHAAGDELLAAIAQRLHDAVRASDTVGRLGGDEFAILAEDVAGRREAVGLADRVLRALEEELFLECGAKLDPRASVGVAVVEGGADPDETLRRADTAMYRAKRAGGGRVDFYDDALRDEATARLRMETALRRALQAGELHVALQPIVPLSGNEPPGVEALLRWDHPELGPVPPLTFIPIAEEVGLIHDIGEWVLREACAATARLSAVHATDLHVAVNLSPRQLEDPGLVERVRGALDAAGLPASRLSLEITESALLAATDEVRALLMALRELGVRIVLDDFGTGFSSLSSLREHTVDAIKVDRSFVAGISADDGDRAIVTAIVGMAHALGCQVTGEGVEDERTLQALREVGCDHVQGYLIARPAPEGELALDALLRA
jgi:diguanylate cyclase (GGDEF)-like protein